MARTYADYDRSSFLSSQIRVYRARRRRTKNLTFNLEVRKKDTLSGGTALIETVSADYPLPLAMVYRLIFSQRRPFHFPLVPTRREREITSSSVGLSFSVLDFRNGAGGFLRASISPKGPPPTRTLYCVLINSTFSQTFPFLRKFSYLRRESEKRESKEKRFTRKIR